MSHFKLISRSIFACIAVLALIVGLVPNTAYAGELRANSEAQIVHEVDEAKSYDLMLKAATAEKDASFLPRALAGSLQAEAMVKSVTKINFGYYRSYALLSDGTLWGWGTSHEGRVRPGAETNDISPNRNEYQILTPQKVFENVADFEVDQFDDQILILTKDHSVWGWRYHEPLRHYMDSAASIHCGRSNAIIDQSGTLWMWGGNYEGELGLGYIDEEVRDEPIAVMHDVKDFDGTLGCFAIKTDGSLWSWGANRFNFRILGNGANDDYAPTPVKILNGVDSIVVSASSCSAAAITADGDLWMWGNCNMVLSNGYTGDKRSYSSRSCLSPVKCFSHVRSASLGSYSVAAVCTDGSLWVWGDTGVYGHLASREQYRGPVRVLDGVSSASAGESTAMAIKTDGTLWSWGKNNYFEGNDDLTPRLVMSSVSMATYSQSAGERAGIVCSDGSLWVWGYCNYYGTLGDGTLNHAPSPVCIFVNGEWMYGNYTESYDPPNRTDDASVAVFTKVVGSYRDGAFKKPLNGVAYYSDSYFGKDARTKQGGLAKLSMLASAAAYGKSKKNHASYSKDLLKQCGFTQSYEYAKPTPTKNDTISYAIGHKAIGSDTVVAVWVKGTSTDYEWVSNFNLGKGNVHKGFSIAESDMKEKVARYIKEKKISGSVKWWITGHSRGAAVANLFAKDMTDEYGSSNVYAYTFASPRVATTGKSRGYGNIFNYLNPGDFVTEIAPLKWGYKRYGVDITLASSKKQAMMSRFKSATGKKYGGYGKDGKNSLLKAFLKYANGKTVKAYYKKNKKTKRAPSDFCQKGLGRGLAGNNAGYKYALKVAAKDSKARVVVAKMFYDGVLIDKFAHAHCQTGYLCWVDATY